MKKIKEGEYKKSICSECANKAKWRSTSLSRYACDKHQEHLAELERKARLNDAHMSEADEQTWGRL